MTSVRRWELVFTVVLLLLLWQLAAHGLRMAILPSPLEVSGVFWRDSKNGDLPLHFLYSFGRVAIGTVSAVVAAVPLGLAMGQFRKIHRILSPLIYLLYPVPKVVFVPIILLFFGIGDLSKIVIIFVILFFQILVLVRDRAAALRPELLSSVRSLGAGRRALFRYVYFPAGLPAVFTALRQGVGTAVAVLYIAELFATTRGLGYYIYFHGSTLLDYPAMYAGVVAMSLLGLLFYALIDLLERRLCPWQFLKT